MLNLPQGLMTTAIVGVTTISLCCASIAPAAAHDWDGANYGQQYRGAWEQYDGYQGNGARHHRRDHQYRWRGSERRSYQRKDRFRGGEYRSYHRGSCDRDGYRCRSNYSRIDYSLSASGFGLFVSLHNDH